MKIAIAALLIGSAAAFAPVAQPAFRVQSLNSVVTGVEGKPAKSAEEDIELTRDIILNFIGDESAEESEEAKEE